MDIYLDCLPCFLRQVLEAARMTTKNIQLHEEIMEDTIKLIANYKKFRYSPEIGREMHKIVKNKTKTLDPYKEIKDKNIESALEVYPSLKQFLFKKEDRLYWSLKVASTGNIIDAAIYSNINVKDSVEKELEKEFAICDIEEFKNKLKTAKNLLIIGDNAGETVFDKVLIEELLFLDITYAVRESPIINDATIEDAKASGLETCTKIISTGCDAPGFIVEEGSEEFLKVYNSADLIISKGQGNYETLSEEKREMFFLLKAKCPVIADRLGVDVNNYIFKFNG